MNSKEECQTNYESYVFVEDGSKDYCLEFDDNPGGDWKICSLYEAPAAGGDIRISSNAAQYHAFAYQAGVLLECDPGTCPEPEPEEEETPAEEEGEEEDDEEALGIKMTASAFATATLAIMAI